MIVRRAPVVRFCRIALSGLLFAASACSVTRAQPTLHQHDPAAPLARPYHADLSPLLPDPLPDPVPPPSSQDAPPDAAPPPAPPDPPPPPPPTARVVFSNAPAQGTPSAGQAQFSVSTERELFIHSIWSNLSGEHQELRRIYAPDGSLFYEKILPFSTEISEPVPYTGEDSVPHALVVKPVTFDAKGDLFVSDYLALAGAWIGDHAMIGDWRFEVYLDGATVPNVTSEVTLVP